MLAKHLDIVRLKRFLQALHLEKREFVYLNGVYCSILSVLHCSKYYTCSKPFMMHPYKEGLYGHLLNVNNKKYMGGDGVAMSC